MAGEQASQALEGRGEPTATSGNALAPSERADRACVRRRTEVNDSPSAAWKVPQRKGGQALVRRSQVITACQHHLAAFCRPLCGVSSL